MARQGNFYGWYLVAAICSILFVNVAFPYQGGAILNAAMAIELQLDRKTLGLGFTAMKITSGILGPVVGWVVGRAGARLSIFCGSLALAGAALLMATWVSQGWHYVLVFGTLIALGVSLTSPIPMQTAVTHWFDKRRAFALSVVWAAVGVGSFAAAPLMSTVMATGGSWRSGWYAIAAAAAVTALIAIAFVRNNPSDMGQASDGNSAQKSAISGPSTLAKTYRTADDWSLWEAFWTPANWIIMYGSVVMGTIGIATVAHGVIHLRELGHPLSLAALGLGLSALGVVAGNFLGGYLADRIEPRYIWSMAMMMMAAGIVIFVDAGSPVDIYLFATLYGVGCGAGLVCRPTLVGNYFGLKPFAGLLGMQIPVVACFTAASPFLVGLAYDIQHTYATAFYALSLLSFLGGVMMFFATPPRRKLVAAEATS